jgi:uncharacterized protein (UPF0276 family)
MKHFKPLAASAEAPIGLGLRAPHMDEVLHTRPAVDFFEVHPENFILDRGRLEVLAHIRDDYPLSLHGVGLSLGSYGGLDRKHVAALKDLVDRLDPFLVSDHLSWSTANGVFLNDLLPLPYTRESLSVFACNVDHIQTALKRQILIENPSAYIQFNGNDFDEPEFLRQLVAKTGCGLLLDVNNVFVSANNLGFDAGTYLRAFPIAHVREIHVAGHHRKDLDGASILIDDHGSSVSAPVWKLYGDAIVSADSAATLIEWDSNIPPLEQLLAERAKALHIARGSKMPVSARSLAQLQSEMARALISVEPPESNLNIGHTGHLSVYRNNVRESLIAALSLVYRGVEQLVGEPFFRQTALRFIEINPPREPLLAAYGGEFPEFLESLSSCRSLPYLGDVARLEWRASRASLHKPQASLGPETLGLHAVGPCDRLRFKPQDGVSYLSSRYPVDEIWSFARAGGEGTSPSIDSGAVFLEIAPGNDGVSIRRLDEPEFRFRQSLSSGATLGPAADTALAVDPLFVLFAALRSALADGVFLDCHIDQSQHQEALPCLC